jgi:hypothetical protein
MAAREATAPAAHVVEVSSCIASTEKTGLLFKEQMVGCMIDQGIYGIRKKKGKDETG